MASTSKPSYKRGPYKKLDNDLYQTKKRKYAKTSTDVTKLKLALTLFRSLLKEHFQYSENRSIVLDNITALIDNFSKKEKRLLNHEKPEETFDRLKEAELCTEVKWTTDEMEIYLLEDQLINLSEDEFLQNLIQNNDTTN